MVAEMRAIAAVIRFHLCRLLRVRGYGISILVPASLSNADPERQANWRWLEQYWRRQLPGAEIILGGDEDAAAGRLPFSKSVAVNDAASRARGDIFVIADADVYISAKTVLHCAEEIREAEQRGRRLWFMPYRRLFRLTQEVTGRILASDPRRPDYGADMRPAPHEYTNTGIFSNLPVSQIGHWYGAMIQVMSRKAFFTVGGWDPRFRGWGSEDVAAMMAMDTLYGAHRTIPSQVLHLWHPTLAPDSVADPKGKKRLWRNQIVSQSNDTLSGRYYHAWGKSAVMWKLVAEYSNGDARRLPDKLVSIKPAAAPSLSRPNVSS